jgi:hypothetical protein
MQNRYALIPVHNRYQCIRSPKCISIYRLRDGIRDCYYNDNEDSTVVSKITSPELLKRYCKCTTTNEYISHILVGDDQWLNACVAIERAQTSIKETRFEKKKSKQIAKYTIVGLLILSISTNIHDPIHRRLLDDDDDDDIKKKRIWCIVTYSSSIQIFNSFINIFHFSFPFFS